MPAKSHRCLRFRHAALTSACLFALAGPLTCVHAQASAGSEASAAIAFAIPAGPLDQALTRFGQQAGVAVSVDSALTAGRQSQGVQGLQSITSALNQLLVGSGLEPVQDGSGGFLLRPVPSAAATVTSTAQATTLPTVEITATVGQASTTEGSGSWASPAATIGRSEQSLREIPQSVSVITRERMEAQGLGNLTQALAACTGVTVAVTDPDRFTYQVRGYGVDTLQFDGMAFQTSPSTGGMFIETDIPDWVEVLRGSIGFISWNWCS